MPIDDICIWVMAAFLAKGKSFWQKLWWRDTLWACLQNLELVPGLILIIFISEIVGSQGSTERLRPVCWCVC